MTRVTLGPIQSFLTLIDTTWYHGPYEESAVLALISCFVNEEPGGLAFAVVGFILALSDHRLFSSSVGHCPDPVLLNGKFSFRWPVKVRDTITFTCNEHYILKGGNWSQCREDHTWVPPFPTCKSSEYSGNKCKSQRCWSTLASGHSPPHPLDDFLSCVSGEGLGSNRQPRNTGSSRSRASAPVVYSREMSSIQWTTLFSFLIVVHICLYMMVFYKNYIILYILSYVLLFLLSYMCWIPLCFSKYTPV